MLAFDAPVAFDSPDYSFDGALLAVTPSGGGSFRSHPYKKKKKPVVLEPALLEDTDQTIADLELRELTDEEAIMLLLM